MAWTICQRCFARFPGAQSLAEHKCQGAPGLPRTKGTCDYCVYGANEKGCTCGFAYQEAGR